MLTSVTSLVAVLAWAGNGVFRSSDAEEDIWEPWSVERVSSLQEEGMPVFIDFTAEWCLNCKYNETQVLSRSRVRQALEGFATLKADMTRKDPEIAAEIKRLGRVGVPVYVVVSPSGKVEVLPEMLTQRIVLDALERARH